MNPGQSTMGDSFKIDDYQNGTEGRVPCARCGVLIAEDSIQCQQCGLHFNRGTAYDFSKRGRGYKTRAERYRWIGIFAMLIAVAGMLFAGWMLWR
jgi:hypothetical protein